jgi:hypothetical protein
MALRLVALRAVVLRAVVFGKGKAKDGETNESRKAKGRNPPANGCAPAGLRLGGADFRVRTFGFSPFDFRGFRRLSPFPFQRDRQPERLRFDTPRRSSMWEPR